MEAERKMSRRRYGSMVSLKEYVNVRFREQNKAVALAQKILDSRLESMNEFREDFRQQAAQFMTRREFQLFQERVSEDIRSLRESRATSQGKASQLSVNITFLIALLGLIVGVVRFFLK